MSFKVELPAAVIEYPDDGDHYVVDVSGALVIRTADGRKLTYSPTAWTRVDEDPRPPNLI